MSCLGRRLHIAAVMVFAATSITIVPGGVAGADATRIGGLTASRQFVQSVGAAPSNDDVSNAYALFADLPRTAFGTNENATKEPGEDWHGANPGGRSVWFRWTPASSGPVVIDTIGSSFDTLLGVYTGAPSDLRAVASNDDIFESFTNRPRQSRLWLDVTAGTTYYIAVDGYAGGGNGAEIGTVYLNLARSSALPAVPSDQFANALPFNLVQGGVEQLVSNNINATGQNGEPLAASYPAERSVWFTFVAPSAGSVSADTATSGFDTILDIFSGTTLAGLSPVANGSNDDAVNTQGAVFTRTSKVTGVPVVAGQRYYLRVAAYDGVQGVVNVDVGFVADGVATPPSAPGNVIATGSDGAITVSWNAPLSMGSQPITGYRVTANPGGATCSWASGPLTCTVGGLTNGTPYTVTVVALSAAGQSQPSLAIPPVVPGSTGGLIPLVPSRILDTRLSGGALSSGQTRDLEVLGRGGVPSSGVSAVVMNVTVTEPTNPGYVSVFPTGSDLPNASSLNFAAEQTVPNLVVAKVGVGGNVSLFNYGGTAHLIADVVGWVPVDDGVMRTMPPVRLMDTRSDGKTIDDLFARFGALSDGRTESLAIAGRAGIPAIGVDAVVLNVIAVGTTAPGFLSVFPTGEDLPTASNVNFVAGQTVPNLVIAKLGRDGQVSIHNCCGTTHVVVDVVGWYPAGSGFVPTSPARLLDTRPSSFTVDGAASGQGAVGAEQVLNLTVRGRAGLPASGVGAVVLNVTVTEPTAPSFVTAYPAGSPLPVASNLNFVPGQTVANLVIAKVGANGQVSLYNLAGSTHIIADIVGWYPT